MMTRSRFFTWSLSATEWLVLIALSASIIPMIEVLKLLQRTGDMIFVTAAYAVIDAGTPDAGGCDAPVEN